MFWTWWLRRRGQIWRHLKKIKYWIFKYKYKWREGWLKVSYEQNYFTSCGRYWGSIQSSWACWQYFCRSNGVRDQNLTSSWDDPEKWEICAGPVTGATVLFCHFKFSLWILHIFCTATHSPSLSWFSSLVTGEWCIASLMSLLDQKCTVHAHHGACSVNNHTPYSISSNYYKQSS